MISKSIQAKLCFFSRVMIHVVAQCHEEGLEHYLRSYVKVEHDPYSLLSYKLVNIHVSEWFCPSVCIQDRAVHVQP